MIPGIEIPEWFRRQIAFAPDGCWLWRRGKNSKGYGCLRVPGDRRSTLAHRQSYEMFVAPIPEGLTIDHLCRVKLCVNPDHLEPVTVAENIRRAAADRTSTPDYPCGHPRTPENTRPRSRMETVRTKGDCRECDRARKRTSTLRRQAVVAA